jgi:hypothetical protein
MKLIIESASPETAFDIDNPGRYVEDYLYKEMVGKVPSHDYFKFEKLRDGKITWMTGDEYIDKCINDIFNLSYDQVVTRAVNEDKVNEYAEKMLNGVTFPVCYLDYPYRQQEGRHRALAFKKAFGENAKMPVLEIFDATKENVSAEEILDYCVRRWNAHYDFFFPNIASNFGISEKEINKLLGRDSDEDEFIENQDDVYEDDLDNLDDEILLDDPDDTTFDW